MNVIVWLEYELAYYDSAVRRFNNYPTRAPPKYVFRKINTELKKRKKMDEKKRKGGQNDGWKKGEKEEMMIEGKKKTKDMWIHAFDTEIRCRVNTVCFSVNISTFCKDNHSTVFFGLPIHIYVECWEKQFHAFSSEWIYLAWVRIQSLWIPLVKMITIFFYHLALPFTNLITYFHFCFRYWYISKWKSILLSICVWVCICMNIYGGVSVSI